MKAPQEIIKLPTRHEGLRVRDSENKIIVFWSGDFDITQNEANLTYVAECINEHEFLKRIQRQYAELLVKNGMPPHLAAPVAGLRSEVKAVEHSDD